MKFNEYQVCNLELSKRLKELGVKQESLWYWDHIIDKDDFDKGEYNLSFKECHHGDTDDLICAFTVAELGSLLRKQNDFYIPYLDGHNKGWISPASTESDTEANARAKMLIHLIENKLIETNNVLR